MKFAFPLLDNVTVKFFEPVVTEDPDFRIVETGIEYEDGKGDTLAIGARSVTFNRIAAKVEERSENEIETAAVMQDLCEDHYDPESWVS